jgi:hypothetical protein
MNTCLLINEQLWGNGSEVKMKAKAVQAVFNALRTRLVGARAPGHPRGWRPLFHTCMLSVSG